MYLVYRIQTFFSTWSQKPTPQLIAADFPSSVNSKHAAPPDRTTRMKRQTFWKAKSGKSHLEIPDCDCTFPHDNSIIPKARASKLRARFSSENSLSHRVALEHLVHFPKMMFAAESLHANSTESNVNTVLMHRM